MSELMCRPNRFEIIWFALKHNNFTKANITFSIYHQQAMYNRYGSTGRGTTFIHILF